MNPYLSGLSQVCVGQLHDILVQVAKIKEMLDNREVRNVTWLPKELQIADCLTKRSSSKIPLLQALEQGRFMN